VRGEAGRAFVQPGGPAPLGRCASQLVVPSGTGEVTLVFEPGRRRHATLGPLGETSVPLEATAIRAIEEAIRMRAPAVDSWASEVGGGGVVRVPLRLLNGMIFPTETEERQTNTAALALLLYGICVPITVPYGVTFVLPVRLHGPPPDPDGAFGQAPDCQVPADCSPRTRCVTAAMGGSVGCTGETCCGPSECANGCMSDADCPRCRPRCTARGGEPGACR
jgi:hypothetical protein